MTQIQWSPFNPWTELLGRCIETMDAEQSSGWFLALPTLASDVLPEKRIMAPPNEIYWPTTFITKLGIPMADIHPIELSQQALHRLPSVIA